MASFAATARGYVSVYPDLDNQQTGLNVNDYLGAGRFYDAGFTGSSAVLANVEAGLIWSDHETMGNLARTIVAPEALGDIDRHATWVAMIEAGRPTAAGNEYQRGIAYGTTLWSAAIATQWTGAAYTRSFNFSIDSFIGGYRATMVDADANGRTADVVNSSFSSGSDPEAARFGDYSRAVDAMAALTGKVVVCSAGNNGPVGQVGAPASGFNTIAVASLGNDLDVVPYDRVSSFSSRGPQGIYIPKVTHADFYNPDDGTWVPLARGVIDIAAPGEDIVSAFYSGSTGGNRGGVDLSPGQTNLYSNGISGTSFAAPSVAGGATLIVDAARQRFGNATRATDGRAAKAILLNSADKIAGWSNGQSLDADGVIRTTQALDYASGAGRMNLGKAYDQLLAGTTDVPGDGGGRVQSHGWDMGVVHEGSPNDYAIADTLVRGEMLTATLTWFADRTIDFSQLANDADENSATAEVSFDDLTLQVWRGAGATTLVAESVSPYNEVEHLNVELPATDDYTLRVLWAGEVWDLVNDPNQTTYGLAWTVVPEPTTALTFVAVLCVRSARRRTRG